MSGEIASTAGAARRTVRLKKLDDSDVTILMDFRRVQRKLQRSGSLCAILLSELAFLLLEPSHLTERGFY